MNALKLVEGGIEAEAHQAFKLMKESLAKWGLTLKNVFKCLVMMGDIK